MNKKIGRIGILLAIAAAVIFVLVDFFRDSSKEEAVREAASQQEQVLREEAEEPNKDIEFGQSDDFEEDIELDEDASEKKQRWITCSFLWSK